MTFRTFWDDLPKESEEKIKEREEKMKFRKYMDEYLNTPEGLELILGKLEEHRNNDNDINKIKKIK